jgi:hypothetical protein
VEHDPIMDGIPMAQLIQALAPMPWTVHMRQKSDQIIDANGDVVMTMKSNGQRDAILTAWVLSMANGYHGLMEEDDARQLV